MTARTLPDPHARPTISIEEAAGIYGIGRALAYALARRGELPGAKRLGSRWVVITAEVARDLGLAEAAQPTSATG